MYLLKKVSSGGLWRLYASGQPPYIPSVSDSVALKTRAPAERYI